VLLPAGGVNSRGGRIASRGRARIQHCTHTTKRGPVPPNIASVDAASIRVMVRLPLQSRWARFGPPDRAWFTHIPRGGFCVSAFLIVRNRRGEVLLGQPKVHRDWPEKGCLPIWRVNDVRTENGWILPASHFLMEESPEHAAKRIMRDWAGISQGRPRLLGVESEVMPTKAMIGSGRNRHRINHWALCFVYELRTYRPPRPPRGWAELRFVPVRELKTVHIGRNHGDLLFPYLAPRAPT
jgi:ADP-ribose pyrophosphatase YjhB (NUDIX family)